MFGKISVLVSLTTSIIHTVHAVAPTVALNYSTYVGTDNGNGISQWLGIRYAAPPLGNLRFAAPQDPIVNTTVQMANKHGLICLATGDNPLSTSTSEDCLFLDLYAPTAATTTSKLPVYFFIQGGGFNSDSNANYNGTGLLQAGNLSMIVVNFNYRVGPYGFLAGSEIPSYNNGLKDALKALQWIQRYISQFGGDPDHVTIGGDSAGAGAVTLLLSAYGGIDLGLFHAAAAESQSFATVLTVNQSQFMYDNLVIRAECTNYTDTLACLRNLTAVQLQTVNINTPLPGATAAPLYMYGPTLDYDLIQDVTYALFAAGKFQKLPVIFGDDTNGGTVFVPRATASLADSDIFLKDQFPYLTLPQLTQANAMYPVSEQPQFAGTGYYYRQVAKAYGDMRYMCPGIYLGEQFNAYGQPNAWNYLWNVTDPVLAAEGYGVTHTIEVNAIWGPQYASGGPASYLPGGVNAAIVPVVQAYWTSFIRTYNPNTYRLAGSPVWGTQVSSLGSMRIEFITNGTTMELLDVEQAERCAFWNGIGVALHQ